MIVAFPRRSEKGGMKPDLGPYRATIVSMLYHRIAQDQKLSKHRADAHRELIQDFLEASVC